MSHMENVQYLILGAGPTGLSAAYHLAGERLILEKEDRVGGLCRSFHMHGGVFDIGGHSFHTPFPDVQELVGTLMGSRLEGQKRDARIFTHGAIIQYPFQKFFEQIPDPRVVEECRHGLAQVQNDVEAANFEEYVLHKFGDGIAKHFMLPYNRKLWGHDLTRLSSDWTSERVAAPKGTDEKFETSGGRRKPLQADTHVYYPAQGGFDEIYKAFLPHVPAIALEQEVTHIDLQKKVVYTQTGAGFGWESLISTLPLPELLNRIDGAPSSLKQAALELEYLSLLVVFLLIGRQLPDTPQRIYCADPAIPPHKIALNHHSSKHLECLPHHGIMAEISISPEKPLHHDVLIARTIQSLVDMGILQTVNDVIWHGSMEVKYAYPAYTHRRPAIVKDIKQYLGRYNVHSTGRFGDWEYVNSDQCIKKGMVFGRQFHGR